MKNGPNMRDLTTFYKEFLHGIYNFLTEFYGILRNLGQKGPKYRKIGRK